jgi:beta-aspartyl-peptidase (threonine type)
MSAKQARCLEQTLLDGYRMLKAGMPALNVVEAAIRMLEASGLFNAGLGANRQLDQVQRMDASIMEGRALRAGAVASIEKVLHPITAARLVMQRTPHVLLVGERATRFARHVDVEPMPRHAIGRLRPAGRRRTPSASAAVTLFHAMARPRLRKAGGQETVGAVALDGRGTVAAGASTGGVDVMLPGRVGDTPLIGCGVYADDEAGAVSMTGLGESIVRVSAAKGIVDLLELKWSAERAADSVLKRLVRRTGGSAGTLVVSSSGTFAIRHVTPRMAAGYWNGAGSPIVRDRFR